MNEIFIQSSLYEDGRDDLRRSLSLAFISVDFDFKVCFKESDNFLMSSVDSCGDSREIGELLNKAISLYEKERLETFYLFCCDDSVDLRFTFY